MFAHHNSAISCSFFTDYKYLCYIRATAKWHKEEAWYEGIYALRLSIKDLNILKQFG